MPPGGAGIAKVNPRMKQIQPLTVIGGGLAGCEAAWQAARAGVQVRLLEMKPHRFSPAHQSAGLAELVCSNSLRGSGLQNAVGLLKEELRRSGSFFIQAADQTAVPAGGALAVDRQGFSEFITERIENDPLIEVMRREVVELPSSGMVIVASGPLTSAPLAATISHLTGSDQLYFYDAIAPIVEADSIDFSVAWKGSRYGKGGDDYINCPLTREEYGNFIARLSQADRVAPREFEKLHLFEGCMPVEDLVDRGEMTLAFGPMKPVGLPDPRTGREPFAVVQLRQDNRHATLFNMVGFQTKLTHPEQRLVFRTIPGLENARFARLGSLHRNTFLNAPRCLGPHLEARADRRILFAGQIAGVEGYVESAATGFLAGRIAACRLKGLEVVPPPPTTALGALLSHLGSASAEDFQPMNINYGLFPPLPGPRRKRTEQRLALADRALADLEKWRTDAF